MSSSVHEHNEKEPLLEAQDEDEYEVEEVEVEVTDDEQDEPEPVVTPSRAPGKVKPSSAVKSMVIKSPETVAKTSKGSLNPAKNPFPTFGAWTEKDLSDIEILFPVLGVKHETTNEKTRQNTPEGRFWKGLITFKYHNWASDTIRFDNVHIPFHPNGKDYGSSFIYLCLPGFSSGQFSTAGKTRRPTVVNEKSLVPDNARWWKIANDVSNVFGVVNKSTNKFQVKSLTTVFDTTQSGVIANLVLKFYCKASTDERLPLRSATPCKIAVEVVRGYIEVLDVDVQTPVRIKNVKPKVEPVATRRDVASDDLMKRLADLGL